MAETKFPYKKHEERLHNYQVFGKLLEAQHYDAFIQSGGEQFENLYDRLRFVVVNFNGLVAKISADMLFGENLVVEGDNQDFIDAFIYSNNLYTQFWESAVSNASLGDAVFKIRVEDGKIKAEDTDPSIYFPKLDSTNPRIEPEYKELAWVEKWGDTEEEEEDEQYLIRERHKKGEIELTINRLSEDGEIGASMDVSAYNDEFGTDYEELTKTGIDKSTIVHIPNFRYRGHKQYFGTSDFLDLHSLQFELDNRMTKIANILDKHSDQILSVQEGVLDETGNVRREMLNMIEMGEEGVIPEYIVWNANLDAAFDEIDKLMEFLFMTSETSPEVMGLGKGQAESGRALKMRLIRLLMKTARKQKYYTRGIQEIFEVAQRLSVENGHYVEYHNEQVKVDSVEPISVNWKDGLPNDIQEEVGIIDKRLNNETITKKQAIMQLDGVTEEEAEQTLKEVNQDRADFKSILDKEE